MILWRIEWIFDLSDNYLIVNDKVEDIKTIGEILSEHLMKPEIKEKLSAYENTPVEEWCIFMKAERSPVRIFVIYNAKALNTINL
jgi:hypothetical protein